jgi:hypothetical protein
MATMLRWREHKGGIEIGVRGFYLAGLVALGVLAAGVFSVATARAEGVCPNEALRSELDSGFLPDCRAYEMVTPVYKEGHELNLADSSSFSSDGSRAFLRGLGAVVGIEGEGETLEGTAVYMDTRTAAGWQLSPLNPPASEFVGYFDRVEADSGASLWVLHTPAQSAMTRDLYVRSESGAYSLVGPLATPENSVGEPSDKIEFTPNRGRFSPPAAATNNYDHVVLATTEASSTRWSFDDTVGSDSLYEYSGLGNPEPILIGVSGGKDSTHLLDECGTVLGSAGSVYNALSSDGETIFFSLQQGCGVPVVEVWARRHGSLRSSAPAESVDVSARAPEPACTGACRVSTESGKEFEGASENGERVFFTSTQQLMNAASQDPEAGDSSTENEGCSVTTGVGGCNLYEYAFNPLEGEHLKLLAGGAEVLGVSRIAENGSRVYFVAKGELTTVGNEFGATAIAGQPNLYAYDTEEAERNPDYKPTFIATLSFSDSKDWEKQDIRPVQVTPDGRFLLFPSSQPGLTPDDTATTSQLFEYDAQTGELVRVSQGENGYNDDGNETNVGVAVEPLKEEFQHTDFQSSANQSSMATDGMTVAFESRGRLSALASSAEDNCSSIYEYRGAGSISNGGVRLVSDGLDVQEHGTVGCGAAFEAIDAGGDNILFSTADPLSKSDTDGVQRDIYDARVDGGFALSAVSAACQGEACLGAPVAPPALASPNSVAVSGAGNLAPSSAVTTISKKTTKKAIRCIKGKKLRHGKCVKARLKVKAKTNRRAGR